VNDYFQILSEVAPEFWTSPPMLAMVFVFGSIWGSFLNVCVYRIPREISVVTPGSHCGSCASPVAWYDNLPILSWFILRGRCRRCQATFSFRYPLIEALTGGVFLLTWIYFGPSWLTLAYWLFLFGLLVGTFIDFEFYILPDRITLGGMVIGLVASVLVPALHGVGPDERLLALTRSAIGLGLGWGVLYLVRVMGELAFRKEAMGLGDVKLLGAIGAFVGWQGVLFTLVASSLLGTIFGVLTILVRGRENGSKIPFGPYISLAAALWIFQGRAWWAWYLRWMFPEDVF
jgi:leader peptidase (prepilin peptidase)/N-methyltransferase